MIDCSKLEHCMHKIHSILFQNSSFHNCSCCTTCFVLALIFLFDGHLYCELKMYGASSSFEVNEVYLLLMHILVS